MVRRQEKGVARSHAVLGVLLCATLVVAGLLWRGYIAQGTLAIDTTLVRSPGQWLPTLHHPIFELLKLVAAYLIGRLITSIYQHTHLAGAGDPTMALAQMLLCVSGALMMILIGDSLARAFGVAGGAAIVRFRTPVRSPVDAMILFLLLGLGMACGVGAFATAGLGTLFLWTLLHFCERVTVSKARPMLLSVTAGEAEAAMAHIREVFDKRGVPIQARNLSGGTPKQMKYEVLVAPQMSLDELSMELQGRADAAIESVSWSNVKGSKKSRKGEDED